MVKLTNSKGKLNWGLVAGGLIGTVVPVIVTAVTGGLGAVTVPSGLRLPVAPRPSLPAMSSSRPRLSGHSMQTRPR